MASIEARRDSTDVAAPQIDAGSGGIYPYFLNRHEAFLARRTSGPVEVLFLGDSITEDWNGTGDEVWKTYYRAYDPANFGISGDKTQNVLWRLENGELEGISPRVVVLLIGTNNVESSAADMTRGVGKVVDEIHRRLPETRLLLLGIFPRGKDPNTPAVRELRNKIKAVNAELAKREDGDRTRYLDLGPKFLDANGVLPENVMPDGLHPNRAGYQIWAENMQPLLEEMLR